MRIKTILHTIIEFTCASLNGAENGCCLSNISLEEVLSA
jgi:hypothetical protein